MYGIGIKDHIEELRTQARVTEQSRDDWKACAEELAHYLQQCYEDNENSDCALGMRRALEKFNALKVKQ